MTRNPPGLQPFQRTDVGNTRKIMKEWQLP